MKKVTVLAIVAAIFTLSCNKERAISEASVYPLSDAVVEVIVDDCTKAPKKAWTEGDKINVWFDDHYSQDTPDLVIGYEGGKWVKSSVRDGAQVKSSGTLCAVYLSSNNLDDMYQEKSSTAVTYRAPRAKSAEAFRCTPLLMGAKQCAYTYDSSTTKLSSTIGGWIYQTRFKVVVAGLTKDADYYALKVYRPEDLTKRTYPFDTFSVGKDGETDDTALTASYTGKTYYAGGVQESDGVAFYFTGLAAAQGEKVHFGLRIYGEDTKIYTATATAATSPNEGACRGVILQYSSFSAAIDGGIAAEGLNNGGEVEFEDRPAQEYTLTKVSYDTNSATGKSADARTVDGMHWMDKLKFDNRDKWGGFDGVKPDSFISENTEGYWRTGMYHGKKVFVDPDGNVALLTGMNCVIPDPLYTSSLAGEPNQQYYHAKFGDGESSAQAWAKWASPILADNGFNFFAVDRLSFRTYRYDTTLGWAISETTEGILHNGNNGHQLSQVENLFFIRTFMWNYTATSGKKFNSDDQSYFTLMFDEDFNEQCRTLVGHAVNMNTGCKFLTNKHFIGYFLDNEHPYLAPCNGYTHAVSLKEFLALPTDSSAEGYYRCNPAAVKWAKDWMKATYGTTTYNSDMEKPFVIAIARYYYSTVCGIIREIDPNHLILGDRMIAKSSKDQELIEACADYCDAVSFTFYGFWDIRDWPSIESYSSWTKGKPLLVAEFYVKDKTLKAPDGTLYLNQDGGGWKVSGQANRGIFYQNACISFIENPDVAGWMHFKWNDDYKTSVPCWVNKGIIVPDYSGPHKDCTDKMQQLNWNEYQILKYFYK